MKNVRPALEKITPKFGSSFYLRHCEAATNSSRSSFWHFHPEIEIVYIREGSGKRHIGHHLSYFCDGDLMMIGENLPHFGFTERLKDNEKETIVQFTSDFAGEKLLEIPEMSEVKYLLDRAKAGLVFYGDTKKRVGERLEKLELLAPFQRLLELFSILQQLAQSSEYNVLHASYVALEVAAQDNERIDKVYQYVRKHFQRPISLAEMSGLTNMTEAAFCRYFKKLSGKTFTQFVNNFRIVHACKLLAERPLSVAEVSLESGFNNFAHFSNQFKKTTGKSPSAYRKELKQFVS